MAKLSNQKLKIIRLAQIMLRETDEKHSLTMSEIIKKLSAYGISAERKSLYDDIECLRKNDLDIISEQKDRTYYYYYYYVGKRQFELAELKLLVDSVQSAKFITEKKSKELIGKLEKLASKYEESQLNRQVYISERVKTENEKIYYNVDSIHEAISRNSKIEFQYFQWNVNKEMEMRKNGELYDISPWALLWDDENYYMVGYDSEAKIIKHYRVDKMLNIRVTGRSREGREKCNESDMSVYAKKMFGMFSGKEESVCLMCHNSMSGVIIDRFGKDVAFLKVDDEHFKVYVKVSVSNQFIAWIMGLGENVKIVGPESVVEKVRDEVKRLVRQYDI